jgi:23S rRNA (guanosine2251-2'-O)-methyltransferase
MQNKDKIYGIHSVMEALKEAVPINKVLIQKDIHNERIGEIIQILKISEIPFQFVPKEKLNRITGKNHQGIIALGSVTEFYTIEQILPVLFEKGAVPLIGILSGITDVRNFGAIARSAECLGVDALVIPAQGSAMINEDAMQASAGALHKIPICREINFLRSVKYIKDSGLALIACTEKAEIPINKIDLKNPSALVLGSEGTGISEEIQKLCSGKALIPMQGEIQSLNVSVSAGIIFYEAQRQRNEMK